MFATRRPMQAARTRARLIWIAAGFALVPFSAIAAKAQTTHVPRVAAAAES